MERLVIGGHSFLQEHVEGRDLGRRLARLFEDRHPKRVFLMRKGGCVIRGISTGATPADEPVEGHYVLIVDAEETSASS